MSYFELQFSHPCDLIKLKTLKETKALLSSLDPKILKAFSAAPSKDGWILEGRLSAQAITALCQKQAIFYGGKILYADPFNEVNLSHKLSYDGNWHLEKVFEINKKQVSEKDVTFHSTGRWIIHKNFLYYLDSSIDRRHLETIPSQKLEDAQCLEWIQDPTTYPYADKLEIDETVELFENKPSQVTPTLYWSDYAWTEARLEASNSREMESFQKDLEELGACVKKLPGGLIRFFWQNPHRLYEAMEFLLESGWKIKGPKSESLSLLGPIEVEKISHQRGQIEIKAWAKPKDTSIKAPPIAAGALSHYLKKSAKYLPVDEKTWLLLPPADRHPELLQGRGEGDTVRLEPWRLQTLKELPCSSMDEYTKSLVKLAEGGFSQKCPSSVGSFSLREYQKRGVEWLLQLASLGIGGLLADEMGLGKTIQTLAFLHLLESSEKIPLKQSLIVAPRSLMHTWRSQIYKLHPNLPKSFVYLHHGKERIEQTDEVNKAGIVLTTYQTLRQDFSLFSSDRSLPWRVAIFDECHLWRNPQTQGYQILKTLPAELKIGLSGTPIYNSLGDLWHQLKLFAPTLVQEETIPSTQAIEELRPLWLRRSKEEVAPELPQKIEETLWLEMDQEQANLYQKMLSTSLKEEEGKEPSTFQILEKILRLRQCCLWPALIDPRSTSSGVKAEQLLLDLETLLSEGRSVLVFSQFASALSAMHKLSKENWTCHYIDSHTQNREKVLELFQEGPPSALFMTLGTGSVGLNLTRASAVILLDPWWNESVENQAIDRAHRIGQKQTVLVRRYMVQDSLEEAMEELKASKRESTKSWLTNQAGENFELDLWQKLREF